MTNETHPVPQPATEHDIYTDPALTTKTSDPVAEFIKRNWKPVLVIALAVFAVIYIRDSLRASSDFNKAQAADSLAKVRSAYEDLKTARAKLVTLSEAQKEASMTSQIEEDQKKQSEEIADTQKTIDEINAKLNLQLAVLRDGPAPYKDLTTLYQGLIAREMANTAGVKEVFKNLNVDQILSSTDVDVRFVGELSLLTLARTLTDYDDSVGEGRSLLKKLAEKATTVQVTAAVALARTAQSDDERKEALIVLTGLQASQPEQAALLDDEVKRLR